jgi:hypothetical protein
MSVEPLRLHVPARIPSNCRHVNFEILSKDRKRKRELKEGLRILTQRGHQRSDSLTPFSDPASAATILARKPWGEHEASRVHRSGWLPRKARRC